MELKDYYTLSKPAAALYQLTSARTIKALMVLVLLGVVVALLISGRDVPDVITAGFYTILGWYFGDRDETTQDEEGL